MKKYLIATAFLICFNLVESQNCFRIVRGVDALGIEDRVVLTNNDEMNLGVLSIGEHVIETGDSEVAYIIVNDTPCYPGEPTTVWYDENLSVVVRYIVKSDGIIYDIE